MEKQGLETNREAMEKQRLETTREAKEMRGAVTTYEAKALDRMRGKGMVGNSVEPKRTDMQSDGIAKRWFVLCSNGIE